MEAFYIIIGVMVGVLQGFFVLDERGEVCWEKFFYYWFIVVMLFSILTSIIRILS